MNLLILDYVVAYNGYYGDITRTFLDTVKPEFKKIYNIVNEALENVLDTLYAGCKANDIDKLARKVIEKYGYGKYFIHSTGHGIGIEVHEPPRLSSIDQTILEANMVVTVEPGIYIPGVGG